VAKHTAQGQVVFDLTKARSKDFAVWKGYAAMAPPKVVRAFEA
jgi:hypothetical protein